MQHEVCVFPASFAQQRLWFLSQLEPDSTAYNMPIALRVRGALDVAALEQGLAEIVRRHAALRTTFEVREGQPMQFVAPRLSVTLPVVDLRELPEAERQATAQRLIVQEARRPFDLASGPLFRGSLLRLGQEEYILLLTMHHIISDGWSRSILFRELAIHYEAFSAGKPCRLPELPIQYTDFAVWQRQRLQGEVLAAVLAYWKEQLRGAHSALELPGDRPRPAVQTYRGARQRIVLPQRLSQSLKALGLEQGATLFMKLLAALKVLLFRYTGQEDIVVGCPIAGRTRKETEELIGFFVNTLVLRTDLSGDPTFRELLRRVREVTLGAYTHQDLPFEKLVEELRPNRDLSRTPFFQVFLNMLNQPDADVQLSGLTVESLWPLQEEAKFDLTLYAQEREHQIHLDLVYNSDLFDPERMMEMLEQFRHLLSQIVENPDEGIGRFSLVTLRAKTRLPDPTLGLESNWEGAVHTRFSQQAHRFPERLAIIDTAEAWTYNELDCRSNQLAHYLRANGIQSQDVVAIFGHRSAPLVWAMLGVLKAGAAFTILDPSYPASRLIDYLCTAKPRGWLQLEAAGVLPNELEEFLLKLPCDCRMQLSQRFSAGTRGLLSEYSTAARDAAVAPDDLAYVAFTSGSTGRPKGILGEHKSLSHFLAWHSQTFGLSDSDRFSMLSGLSYDPLLRDIFTPLWLGASLHIPDEADITAPGYLADWMKQTKITVVHLTPAMGQLLTETVPTTVDVSGENAAFPCLRYAFFGGDVLTTLDVAKLRKLAPAVRCINFYGTTETPQAMAYFIVPSQGDPVQEHRRPATKVTVCLGRGIQGAQLLVLNAAGQLAGVGELAEICVRSPYLARGYIGDAELTQQRFIMSPFTTTAGDRFYKTGDLGRYSPDGDVEFVGRADDQVKIRGYRVEPREVEATLGQNPAVRDCAVIAREDVPGEKRLVAYVVPNGEPAPATSELRAFLKQRLPEYMLPSAFVLLDDLPLSPNGKVDRRALPQPDPMRPKLENRFVAPRTPIEESLVGIWSEVLGLERVGIHDNFFELGGHSLLATRVVARVRSVFQAELPLRSLFESPTVAGLALALAKICAEKMSTEELAHVWEELE